MFWQIYFGKYLTESRKRVKSLLGLGSVITIANESERHTHKHQDMKRSMRLNMLKYSMPGAITAASAAYALAVVIDYAAIGSICDDAGDTRIPVLQFLILPVAFLQFTLAAVITFIIRKFKDNVGVNVEIRRIFIVFGVSIPVGVPIMVLAGDGPVLRLVYYLISGFVCNGVFIVSGYLPLREQMKLERRVATSCFSDGQKIEEVLFEDAAALVSFKEFLAREFCEEVLEFYGALFRVLRRGPRGLWCAFQTMLAQCSSLIFSSGF